MLGSAERGSHPARPAAARTRPAGPGPTQRPSTVPSISGPEWGVAGVPTPWWEAVHHPCPPTRVRLDAAEPRFETSSRGRDPGRRNRPSGTLIAEGGGSVMARILAVLSALASLFLIAGAGSKY